MKKKGFTLIELLGVITVLALIALIAIPVITNAIKNKKQELYDSQIELVLTGAKLWGSDNKLELSEMLENEIKIMTLGELKIAGYITNDIKNPLTEELFSNCLEIEIKRVSNNYEYSIGEMEFEECNFDSLPQLEVEILNGDIWTVTDKNIEITTIKAALEIVQYAVTNTNEINNDTEWQNISYASENKFNIERDSGTYYIWVRDKIGNVSESKEVIVEKIDKTAPTVSFDTPTIGTTSINISVTASDTETGISKYEFSINDGQWIDNGTNNSYSFNSLTNNTNYIIKTRVTNSIGLITIKDETIKTNKSYPYGTIVYFNPEIGLQCTNYSSSNSNFGVKSGCMKWYAISENDTSVQLFLDHNTSNSVWLSREDYAATGRSTDGYLNNCNFWELDVGPVTLTRQLENDTNNWIIDSSYGGYEIHNHQNGTTYLNKSDNDISTPFGGDFWVYTTLARCGIYMTIPYVNSSGGIAYTSIGDAHGVRPAIYISKSLLFD